MLYIKAFLAGVAGAIAAATLWVLVAFVLPIAVPMLASRLRPSQGGGIAAATIGSGSILLAALVGFAAGVYSMLRRA
jgi:hypothetical protein